MLINNLNTKVMTKLYGSSKIHKKTFGKLFTVSHVVSFMKYTWSDVLLQIQLDSVGLPITEAFKKKYKVWNFYLPKANSKSNQQLPFVV